MRREEKRGRGRTKEVRENETKERKKGRVKMEGSREEGLDRWKESTRQRKRN